MKSNSSLGSSSIPECERDTCHYLRRNEDISLGTISDLFFCMRYVGHYICGKEFHIRRKLAERALLLLTISGEGKLFYRGSQYALTRGTCMLIDPQAVHEYYAVGDRWEFKFLHFDGALSAEYLSYIDAYKGSVFSLSSDEFLRTESALDRILDMTGEDEVNDYPGISGLIYSLLILLMSHNENSGAGRAAEAKTVAGAAAYIRANYMNTIHTEDIARAVNLSRSYMTELFTHTYGISPHEYVVRVRLSVAQNLLINTALSITEIAEQTGFRDVSSFSRVFKRQNGISPAKYRAKYNIGE